jgi:predicted permease
MLMPMSAPRDLRTVARQLVRARGYAATAIVTLALSIGAATLMVSAAQAVLLRPLPIVAPGQLLVAWGSNPAVTAGVIELSYLDIADLARESRTLVRAAAVSSSAWPTVLDGIGEPAKLAAAGVSGSFFDTLGARAQFGRTIGVDDDRPGAPAVVVISHDLWAARFGSDPSVVDRTITLDGQPTRVVGVMPTGFDFPRGTDLWTSAAPVLASAAEAWNTPALRSVGVFYLVGRRRDGVTPAAALSDLSSAAERLPRKAGDVGYTVVAQSFERFLYGAAQPALLVSIAAVVVLLVIACANVSGLMLTRAAHAARESAVRLALGASRRQVSGPWILEAVLIAGVGGVLGWMVARWGMRALVALVPAGVPGLAEATLDERTALASLLIVGGAAALCALAPARLAGRTYPAEALADVGRSVTAHRSTRARAALQVIQTALAVVLLVSAGLVVRSFDALTAIDLGFDPAGTLSLTAEPRLEARPANAWMQDLVARVSAIPGVEAAGAVYLRPLALGPIGQGALVTLEGQPETPDAARANPVLNYQVATPGYFAAMRIPVVRGRDFGATDTAQSPRVAIVSEGTAARLWPGQDPIGRRLRTSTFERGTGRTAWREVVGVVRDVRYRGLTEVQFDMYDPAAQTPIAASDLILRTQGSPLSLVAAVHREARALDPRVLISRVATLDAIVAEARAPWRFVAWILAVFAGLAFGLSTVGLASLVALDVVNRHRELAIRSALGAGRGAIVGGVLQVAHRRVAAGAVAGLALSALGTRALRGLLVGVEAIDWPIFASVVLLVAAVTLVASYLPARRAASVDLLALLRE